MGDGGSAWVRWSSRQISVARSHRNLPARPSHPRRTPVPHRDPLRKRSPGMAAFDIRISLRLQNRLHRRFQALRHSLLQIRLRPTLGIHLRLLAPHRPRRHHLPLIFDPALLLPCLSIETPDAEDAVQETLLRAWRYRDSVKEGAPCTRTWIYELDPFPT